MLAGTTAFKQNRRQESEQEATKHKEGAAGGYRVGPECRGGETEGRGEGRRLSPKGRGERERGSWAEMSHLRAVLAVFSAATVHVQHCSTAYTRTAAAATSHLWPSLTSYSPESRSYKSPSQQPLLTTCTTPIDKYLNQIPINHIS